MITKELKNYEERAICEMLGISRDMLKQLRAREETKDLWRKQRFNHIHWNEKGVEFIIEYFKITITPKQCENNYKVIDIEEPLILIEKTIQREKGNFIVKKFCINKRILLAVKDDDEKKRMQSIQVKDSSQFKLNFILKNCEKQKNGIWKYGGKPWKHNKRLD
jgi:hypothetical protein